MNKIRRNALQEIYDKLTALSEELEMIKDEEDESRENMPENLQGSERYEQSETASGNMDEAIEYRNWEKGVYESDEAIEYLTSACDSIESAMEG